MTDALFVFLATLTSFLPAAWLCVLVVRGSLKYPLSHCLLMATALTVLYALLDVLLLLDRGAIEYLGVLLYLVAAYFAFRRVSALPPFKLFFLTMMVFSYYCFIVGVDWGLDFSRDVHIIIHNLLSIVFPGIPFYLLLRRVFWPIVRDMEGSYCRYLWVVPFTFSVVLTLLANTVGLFSPTLYFVILAIAFLGAVVIYYMVLRTLAEATSQTREAERAQAASAYIALQAEQYELITQNIELGRALHHDLRHHLLVLKQYIQGKDFQSASAYCDELTESAVGSAVFMLCENFAVNSVAVHYYGKAQLAQIDMDIELQIGERTTPIHEGDISVIIGNLLENALEACERIPEHQRWLRMRCRMVGDNLIIVMDNSFDGVFLRAGEEVLSRKHAGTGIGLSSIQAVARKYGGDTAFEAKGDTFQSSVYLPVRAGDAG